MCTQVGSSGEMGNAVAESEVQKMKREKDLLMQEVMQLRKEQLMTVEKMNSINHRMQAAEVKQKQMVSFLAKVLRNPTFIGHVKQLKGQEEMASGRGKRKFIKHHHHQPIFCASTEHTNQQIVKYAESDEGSDALLQVFENNEGNQIPKHLLKDIADKLDLDTGGGKAFGGSGVTENLKGKNIRSPQIDSEFPGSDYFVSLPDDIAILEADYISPEAMFPDAIAPADDCVSTAAWNIGLEAGGSLLYSEPAVWDDSLGREVEAFCSAWDMGFNALEEDLDIASYMAGESYLQEHKDDAGWLTADCSKD